MTLLEKIESLGYHIRENSQDHYIGSKMGILEIYNDSKSVRIPNNPCVMAIGCGSVRNEAEARQNAERGIGIVTTGTAIYRSYYAEGKSEKEWALLNVRYSERSYDALEAERTRLHLLRSECKEDGAYLRLENAISIQIGWNEGQLGKLPGENEWCVQYSVRYDVDAVATNYYYFSSEPTVEAAQCAVALDSIRSKLGWRIPETYTCWECGASCFWLDNGGKDIYQCADRAEDKYCGC